MPAVGPDQQAARAEQAERQRREVRDAIDELRWLMSDAKGRRFVWRFLQRAGIWQSSFVSGVPDGDRLTAFNEGRRNEGLWLLDQVMQHCPGRLTEMQKEAKSHERRSSGTSAGAK